MCHHPNTHQLQKRTGRPEPIVSTRAVVVVSVSSIPGRDNVDPPDMLLFRREATETGRGLMFEPAATQLGMFTGFSTSLALEEAKRVASAEVVGRGHHGLVEYK